MLVVVAADVRGCRKCHSSIPAVTDTFNESTLLPMEFSSDSEELDESMSVDSAGNVVNAGGIRTYSVHDFATSARNP